MTRQRQCPTTRRVAFYGRTNQTGPDAGRELARQYQLCRAVAGHFGKLTSHFYDIGAESRYDRARTSDIATAGGPPSREGGWAQLTAELASPNRSIDMVVLADYDRLPDSPAAAGRCWPQSSGRGAQCSAPRTRPLRITTQAWISASSRWSCAAPMT